MKRLWKPNHSVMLSLVVTYLAGAALLALTICGPVFYMALLSDRHGAISRTGWFEWMNMNTGNAFALTVFFYACCPAGWTAIVSLLKLLHNIRKGKVFTRRNVKLLRLLSWCFVFVALTSVLSYFIPMLQGGLQMLMFVPAGFLAVILRVVKNVMEQATIMREEQELTI